MKEVKAVIGKMELTEFIPQPLLVKGVIFVYKSINNKINEMKEMLVLKVMKLDYGKVTLKLLKDCLP